MVMDL